MSNVKFYLVMLLLIGIAVASIWIKFLYAPLITQNEGYKYTVHSGASINSVADDLYSKKVITNRFLFNVLVRLRGVSKQLKAGEYLFPKGSTSSSILNQMVTGTGMAYHAFTIVPGWTFKELREAILQDPSLHHSLQDLSDKDIMARLGHSELNPEGQFYPDTYYFAEGSSDLVILKRALKAMQDKLVLAWQQRNPGLPFKTINDVLIVASLIEKEAFLEVERPIIAGVIVNRLRQDMLLQIDPTVIYGLGMRYDGKIHKENLLEDTVYNTYVHKGLPPTPIAIPSLKSIMATVHPQKHDFLYFVARGNGAHQFSKTLAEHYDAVIGLKKSDIEGFFNVSLLKTYLLKVFAKAIA